MSFSTFLLYKAQAVHVKDPNTISADVCTVQTQIPVPKQKPFPPYPLHSPKGSPQATGWAMQSGNLATHPTLTGWAPVGQSVSPALGLPTHKMKVQTKVVSGNPYALTPRSLFKQPMINHWWLPASAVAGKYMWEMSPRQACTAGNDQRKLPEAEGCTFQ